MKFPLLRKGIISLYQSIKRFPITIFFTTLTTVLLIIYTWADRQTTVEILTRLAMVSALAVPMTLSFALAIERKKWSQAVEYGSYALALCALVLYYFFLLPELGMLPITRYLAVTIALYLAFLFVPYFFNRPGFELYVIKVITRFLVTAIYSAVLFAGLAITLLTIDLLLGIDVSFTFYSNVWLVVAGIFAPCFFLAGLPAAGEDMEAVTYPSLLKILLLYIVMPIILTYTSILYIYFLKTLVTFAWPEGTVSHLVLWFSVFSAGVIFLIYPMVRDNRFVKFFASWFPKLVLPAILVMFMAIAVRINAYGVTENRYFVVALGLWVFGIMLYFSLTKHFRNIILPVSLALVALLTVVGPWSAYSISRSSQNARFEALASEYNMIAGDTLKSPNREISGPDKRAIVSILEYFDQSHSLSDVRLLPQDFQFQDMERIFGFSREDIWGQPGRLEYFQLYTLAGPLDVRGYDYFLNSANLLRETVILDDLTVSYSTDELRLTVTRGNQEIYAKDLKAFAEEIVERQGPGNREVPAEDMTFHDENEAVQVKLVFTGIQGTTDSDGTAIGIQSLEFNLLLREKE